MAMLELTVFLYHVYYQKVVPNSYGAASEETLPVLQLGIVLEKKGSIYINCFISNDFVIVHAKFWISLSLYHDVIVSHFKVTEFVVKSRQTLLFYVKHPGDPD